MLWHDIRLALLSIRRNPVIAALIGGVIAIGIGTSVVAITLYHAKAGNPIWWKNDVLFRVLIDNRPAMDETDKKTSFNLRFCDQKRVRTVAIRSCI